MYNKTIFERKLLQELVAHVVTHILAPFASKWSIIRGTVSLKMFESGQIAVFEGKCRRFRILPKV